MYSTVLVNTNTSNYTAKLLRTVTSIRYRADEVRLEESTCSKLRNRVHFNRSNGKYEKLLS